MGNNEKENLKKIESMNTTRTNGTNVTKGTDATNGTKVTKGTDVKNGTDVQNEIDQLIHECKEHVELLQAVYNALANTYLRNLENRYEGDLWYVMCKGTDIITNELGDIISESDDIIAHADGFFAIAAAYSKEVFSIGGTAEKIYVSQ